MNEINHSRSKDLLEKVYDHLDAIDVSKLSMSELKDFLGVVQQGQFLESYGQMPSYAIGGFNSCAAFNGTKTTDAADETAAEK